MSIKVGIQYLKMIGNFYIYFIELKEIKCRNCMWSFIVICKIWMGEIMKKYLLIVRYLSQMLFICLICIIVIEI